MVGAKIVEMRQKLGWSQARLAKALNVNTKSIKNWENEVSDPSLIFINNFYDANRCN